MVSELDSQELGSEDFGLGSGLDRSSGLGLDRSHSGTGKSNANRNVTSPGGLGTSSRSLAGTPLARIDEDQQHLEDERDIFMLKSPVADNVYNPEE